MNALPLAGRGLHAGARVPRFRTAGDLTLDLAHRDGRVDAGWLDLCEREFALLWRLAQQPGEPVRERQLLAEVWRIAGGPGSTGLAAHIAQVRGKLEAVGLAQLIGTHPEGGWFLDVPPEPGLVRLTGTRPG